MVLDYIDDECAEDDWVEVDEYIANIAGEFGDAARRSTAHRSGLRKAATIASNACSFFGYSVCIKFESFEEQSSALHELNAVVAPSNVRIHRTTYLSPTRLIPYVSGNAGDHSEYSFNLEKLNKMPGVGSRISIESKSDGESHGNPVSPPCFV
jgi:hypothetical protein